MIQVGRLAWKFDWFPDEITSPNYNQRTFLIEQSLGYTPPLAEVLAWYETAPWLRLLRQLPLPQTYEPKDSRFSQLYLDTLLFYQQTAQVLWERTHVILPGIHPASADQELMKGQRAKAVKVNKRVRDSWTTTRRSRRSKSRSRLITHFSRLCGFVQSRPFADLDLLLDPFFLWPPGDSSVLLIP